MEFIPLQNEKWSSNSSDRDKVCVLFWGGVATLIALAITAILPWPEIKIDQPVIYHIALFIGSMVPGIAATVLTGFIVPGSRFKYEVSNGKFLVTFLLCWTFWTGVIGFGLLKFVH